VSVPFLFFAIFFPALKTETAGAFGQLVTAGLRVATYRNLPIFVTDRIYTDYCKMAVNLTIRNNIFN